MVRSGLPDPLILQKFSPRRVGKNAELLFAGDIMRLLHIDTEGFLEGNISKEHFQNLGKLIHDNRKGEGLIKI